MPSYLWKGIQGTQYQSGSIEALTNDEAAYKLSQQGIIITLLQLGEGQIDKKSGSTIASRRNKIPLYDILIFTRKSATMLRAGLPILQTIEMLGGQAEKPALKEMVAQIQKDIESGNSLSAAFAKHTAVFGSIYINLIKAGEASGKLDIFMGKLVESLQKTMKIQSTIKSAMMYPAILMTVATGVLMVMMIYVVPVFAEMYGNTGMELPGPTQTIIMISNFLRNPLGGGVLVATLIAGIVVLKQAMARNIALRRSWHRLLLGMPVLGDIILKSALAKISMVQGNLSAAGVPVIENLEISASSTTNLVLLEAMEAVKRGVFSGRPISVLLREQAAIPRTYADMVEVGERTGNMEEMLTSISTYYEEEFDIEVARLSALMEPVMIVFLGVSIGFILIAMYLPIFKMGQAVTG